MGQTSLLIAVTAIGALAFLARTAVLIGREPGGVDTWYYLAYARAIRSKPGLRVRIFQYLLQDEEQSYAPVFPSLLAILPERILRRSFWAISPAIDCFTLLFLFLFAFKITASPAVALVASLLYAVSPTLVSETRSLSPRSFGILVHVASMVLLLRALMGPPEWPWMAGALASGAVLFLSSATAMASYLFVAACLSVFFADPRFLGLAIASMGFAWLVSLGHLSRVFANYVHAVRFWVRHRRSFGSHPILDSRIYGGPRAAFSHQPKEPGFLGHGLGAQLLRLFGENPLLLALPFAPIPQEAWALRLYVWGVSLSALSVISTIVWPLRAFGPGRGYMKAAIFPTAYVLAAATSTPSGFLRLHALATLAAWAASVASIVFFLTYMRNKDNELTAHVPPGLKAMAAELALRKTGGVVCLPGGYSDYIAYNTGRAVLWGSHSGSLNKFELVAPLWQERVEHAARRHGVRYLIVERAFVDPAILALDPGCALVSTSPGFDLYDLQASPAPAAS